jgi:hypothetical protein
VPIISLKNPLCKLKPYFPGQNLVKIKNTDHSWNTEGLGFKYTIMAFQWILALFVRDPESTM